MCGVVGIVGSSPVNQELYDAMLILQHRGQDAAGMAISDGDRLALRKANGLVSEVFQERHMLRANGNFGVGHVRYPTAGTATSAEAQPMYVNSPCGICIAHNGNITNAKALRNDITEKFKRHLNTRSDSEILLNVFAHELQNSEQAVSEPASVFNAVSAVHRQCIGAYAVVALIIGGGIVGFRDPRGIRPLVVGVRESADSQSKDYMIASETAALDILGYTVLRDIEPGEACFITENGELHLQQCAEQHTHTPCIFEYIYLARPDSVLNDISVYKARLSMGEVLADTFLKRFKDGEHDVDVVIPIPETSRTAALPIAKKLKVDYREGFVKNRYIGRTFIMPGQSIRKKSVRQKLNVIELEVKDKVVLLVEDSIVRGTTIQEVIEQCRQAGAKKVYLASAAPPVRYPNVFGIDMPSVDEFIATERSEDDIEKMLGVDLLVYQELEDLKRVLKEWNQAIEEFECSIFDGRYNCVGVDESYLSQLSLERNDYLKAIEDEFAIESVSAGSSDTRQGV